MTSERETSDTDGRCEGGSERLSIDDLSLKSTDEGPVLEIGDDMLVLLRTFVELERGSGFDSASERFRTDVDSDGENGAWWEIWTGDDIHPLVTIQPEVLRE